MFRKLGLTLCILCLSIFLLSCGGQKDYSNSKTTWSDVTKKFTELEKEKTNMMEALKNKPSIPVKKPNK
jgi:hypothetical protein